MTARYTLIFILILTIISTCKSYRILAIFPFNGRSHFHVLEPIAKALALKGHQVDVFSNFKTKEPVSNYTELEFPTANSEAGIELNFKSVPYDWLFEQESRICDLLGHPTIAKLIRDPPKNPPYDAVLVHMLTGYQCLNAIGYILNVPVIGVVTTAPWAPIQNFIGDPMNLAFKLGVSGDSYKQNLTFWERVNNVVKTYRFIWNHEHYRIKQEPFLKKYLGPSSPSYRELEKNIALIFCNSHYSFYGVKPKTPALVEIGGINIKNYTSILDPKLKKLLDESHSGFIYFSFGTLTVIESLPHVLDKLYAVFRRISPVKVIMRAKNPDAVPKNLSDNVFVFDWLPQQKLLQHPNIKAFVTHGGGLSTQEAIHYAVPVICIPLFAEQRTNCEIFPSKNMGVCININSAKQTDYEDAFQKVLSSPEYKKSMKKFSVLYWDRPQSPQETVNYWVEYVIRHGKTVLRSPAVDLEWWQFELIDVYFFLFSCAIIVIVFLIIVIGYLFRLLIRLSSLTNAIDSKKKFK